MKAIKLECKTAGFLFGDVAKIGKGKNAISEENAEALVKAGLATEVIEVVASAGDSASEETIKGLEAQVATLTEEAKVSEETIKGLEAKVTELTEAAKK